MLELMLVKRAINTKEARKRISKSFMLLMEITLRLSGNLKRSTKLKLIHSLKVKNRILN